MRLLGHVDALDRTSAKLGKTVSQPAMGLAVLSQGSHVAEGIFVQLCMVGRSSDI